MLHPSYTDLMKIANSEVEPGETPVVTSRYSIVMATAKRARQIIDGADPLVYSAGKKPLSIAVEELSKGKMKILGEKEEEDLEIAEELTLDEASEDAEAGEPKAGEQPVTEE